MCGPKARALPTQSWASQFGKNPFQLGVQRAGSFSSETYATLMPWGILSLSEASVIPSAIRGKLEKLFRFSCGLARLSWAQDFRNMYLQCGSTSVSVILSTLSGRTLSVIIFVGETAIQQITCAETRFKTHTHTNTPSTHRATIPTCAQNRRDWQQHLHDQFKSCKGF